MVEDERIILVGESGDLVELKPSAKPGAEHLLVSVRIALAAGLESGLLQDSPFIIPKSEITPTGQSELAEDLSSEGDSTIELPKYYPGISQEDELERQRVELAERMAVPLGIDRNLFLAKLPSRFPDRPKIYEELGLTIPLIVPDLTPFGFNWLEVTRAAIFYDPAEPRVALAPYIYSELKNVEVWKDPRKGVKPFPEAPHAVWIQDGSRYVNRKPKDIRKELKQEERAGDHFKGTGLALLRPDMVKTKYWDLIGGRLGSVLVPCVDWGGGPGFDFYWGGVADPGFRALVCGSEFTVA